MRARSISMHCCRSSVARGFASSPSRSEARPIEVRSRRSPRLREERRSRRLPTTSRTSIATSRSSSEKGRPMKADLEKANEALAGGRSDEASVYAWNALADIGPDDAPELARIARALDDQLLLREIERRGLSTLPAEEPEPEPVKRKPILRLLRALPALAIALFIEGAVVTSIPTESGERHPTARDAASEVRFAQPILVE